MLMSPLLKNLGIAVVLALVLFLGYLVFFGEDEAAVSDDAGLSAAVRDGQEFLMRVRQLDQITLDGSVLSDLRFESLVDFTVQPKPEDVGRDNPFLPIP